MANIELVIKIDEDIYKLGNALIFPLLNKDKAKAFQDMMVKAITNGTPLPKGHGKLIDAKKLILDFYITARFYKTWNLGKTRILNHIDCAETIIKENN